MKYNIYCDEITDREFVHFIIIYLLGENWHIVDPLGHDQINQIALEEILYTYSKKFRKEYKKFISIYYEDLFND